MTLMLFFNFKHSARQFQLLWICVTLFTPHFMLTFRNIWRSHPWYKSVTLSCCYSTTWEHKQADYRISESCAADPNKIRPWILPLWRKMLNENSYVSGQVPICTFYWKYYIFSLHLFVFILHFLSNSFFHLFLFLFRFKFRFLFLVLFSFIFC